MTLGDPPSRDEAIRAYTDAKENITRLEGALHRARGARADAILGMRDAGMTWAEIEVATGLTRQRLNQITREHAG